VLSCGGLIALASTTGRAQQVITICAGVPVDGSEGITAAEADYVTQRRAEDRAALAVLGVDDVVHLDFLDAIYRRGGASWLYPLDGICGELHEQDQPVARAIADAIRPRVPAPAAAEIFAPLAAGRHVDHQLVHHAARALAAEGYRVRYYEDLPYACDARRLLGSAPQGDDWSIEACALAREHMEAKLAAVRCYRSQFREAGDDDRMCSRLREHAAAFSEVQDAYAERLWDQAP
jgi:LmbE family N-acetylglucosaminyl deacetylase